MKVNLVSGACGAEIEGIDLKDTSDSNIETIKSMPYQILLANKIW